MFDVECNHVYARLCYLNFFSQPDKASPSVSMSIYPFLNSWFNSSEIWHVGKGQ